MVYIKHDVSIPHCDWVKALQAKTRSMFTKLIFRKIYTEDEIVRRCIKEGNTVLTPNGVNKRKALSPKKVDAIASKDLRYLLLAIC